MGMTAETSRDPWATLDDLLGVQVVEAVDEGIGPVASYGRCSTEDNQDPETSHGWQSANARKFIEPMGGEVVADFFDGGAIVAAVSRGGWHEGAGEIGAWRQGDEAAVSVAWSRSVRAV
jgi:hypothetical protein